MSREVDERVVQMQFDNAQFERGTRQTMGTLEKLKQSLQFKGVEKGFERISSASQKVDFSEMTKALESIESKFSAVNVIAVTALTIMRTFSMNRVRRCFTSYSKRVV